MAPAVDTCPFHLTSGFRVPISRATAAAVGPGAIITKIIQLKGKQKMRNKIINYIRAGYAGIYLVSPEEQRVEAELKGIAREVGFKLYAWSTTAGLIDTEKGAARQANDPMEALLAIQELPEKTIVILRDFHLFLNGDPNPVLLRQLKDTLQHAKSRNKPLIILGCRLCLPPELEREVTVVEFSLPGKDELSQVLDGVLVRSRSALYA
jgi:hypothetical protein